MINFFCYISLSQVRIFVCASAQTLSWQPGLSVCNSYVIKRNSDWALVIYWNWPIGSQGLRFQPVYTWVLSIILKMSEISVRNQLDSLIGNI